MEKIVSIALTSILLFFLILGFLVGFIRGLRKTASRAIFLIITAILTLFLTIPITNLLLQIKIPTEIHMDDINISGNVAIKDSLNLIIEALLGSEFVNNNPEMLQTLIALPLMIINAVAYVIIFYILKYLLLPLNYLFYKFTFAPKKRKEEFAFSAFNDDNGENTPISQENEDAENTKDGVFVINDPKDIMTEDQKQLFDISIAEEESKKKRKKEKKSKYVPYKKHRLLGGVIGLVIGLFVMSNTLVPFFGALNIARDIKEIKIEHLVGEDTSSTNNPTDQLFEIYDSSALHYITKYSGLEGLSIAEFDYVTTQKIGDKKVTLRNEIKNITKNLEKIDAIYGKYKEFAGDGNLSTLSKDQIAVLLHDTKSLVTTLKEIEFINSATNYVLPIVCNLLLRNDTNFTDNNNVNLLIKDMISAINNNTEINIFDELTAIISLAEYLNNKEILVDVLQNNLGDIVGFINKFDSDFTNKLFELKTIHTTLPHVINIGLTLIDDSINFGFVQNTATASEIKESFSNFVDKTLELAKTIDTESEIYITNESLIPLGKVLQIAKTSALLKPETYKNLVTYATNKIETTLVDLLPDEFDNYARYELLNNISKVDNWEYEMTRINDAILTLRNKDNGILGEVVEGEDLRQGLSINVIMKEEVFVNLGKALDMLEETCIFGAVTNKSGHQISGTASLMLSLIDYAENQLTNDSENDDLSKITPVLGEIKTNIINSNHVYSSTAKTFWKDEMTQISPLVIGVYKMMDSNKFNFDSTLGKNLDKAKSSTLFGGTTTLTLIDCALNIVKDNVIGDDYTYNDGTLSDQSINDKIYELFDGISTKLQTNSVKEAVRTDGTFWEKEIEYYESLKNIADKATTIDKISEVKEIAPTLDHITYNGENHCQTIPSQEIFNIIAFVIRDTKSDNLTADDLVKKSINDTIDNIADKLEENNFGDIENFWQIEFEHIEDLTDIKFNDEDGYSVKENLPAIGETLENITLGYSIKDDPNTNENEARDIRKSYLITHNDIRMILSSAITELNDTLTKEFDAKMKESISKALGDIQYNMGDTTTIPLISFKTELTHLNKLSNLSISSDLFTASGSNATALKSVGATLDEIAFNNDQDLATQNYYYYESENSKIITRSTINQMIIDIFDDAKAENPGTDTKKLAFNDLIKSVQENIAGLHKDSVISWERELGYVTDLVSLNSGKTYTLENASTEIGKTLDAIAFIGRYWTDSSTGEITRAEFHDVVFDTNGICTYIPESQGNSLFVSREKLLETINAFLSDMKTDTASISDPLEKEEKDIINEMINNATKVCTNNTELLESLKYFNKTPLTYSDMTNNIKYVNTETSFSQLKNIKDHISNLIDGIEGDIVALKANDKISGVDDLLQTLEFAPASGIILTRKIAILILKHIEIPAALETTDTGTYYNKLLTHYNTNNDKESQSGEYYSTTDDLSVDSTHNPFDTLLSTVPTSA